ncbi:hypothetical protein SCB49_10005 [unidentified eubacterium SCB49]|nr:hypothetical protein SCB49_10005 [unidentified eubacterium SCB49]
MMIRKINVYLTIGYVLGFFLLQSCSQISNSNINLLTVPNDSIVGIAFVGESNHTVEYSPKGNFIQIPFDYNDYWHEVELSRFNTKIDSKEFIKFKDERPEHFLMFDSLNIGDYKLNFISILEDTIIKKLAFKSNIELRIPNSIQNYYNKKDISSFPEISEIFKLDTLQIYNANFDCFGGSIILYEFYNNETDGYVYRKKQKAGGYDNESVDEWIYHNKDVKDNLTMFVDYLIDKNEKHTRPCPSGNIEFIFRLKSSNEVFLAKDYYCSNNNVYLSDMLK